MWLFSFRYWNIAYVMPVLLSGNQVSSCFRLTTISIFFTGVSLNILFPVIYCGYLFKIYANFNQSTLDMLMEYWSKNWRKIYGFKYGIGALESLNAFFMLWAILKLYCKLGRRSNLREFTK